MDNHEENVDEEIVEEYGSTPVDLERMHNHYYLGNEVRLNFIDPSIREHPGGGLSKLYCFNRLTGTALGRRRIILRTIGERAFCRCIKLRRINQFLKDGGVLAIGRRSRFSSCSVLWVGDACFQECLSDITMLCFTNIDDGYCRPKLSLLLQQLH